MAAMPVKKLEITRARSPRYECGAIASGRRSVVTVVIVWRLNEKDSGGTGSRHHIGTCVVSTPSGTEPVRGMVITSKCPSVHQGRGTNAIVLAITLGIFVPPQGI